MISSNSIMAMIFTLIVALGLPVFLTVYLIYKRNISFKAFGVGALIFFIMQIFLRTPLLGFAAHMSWYQVIANNAILLALFLSLTAGIFEEIGRFIGFKYFLDDRLDFDNGVAYGVGHGGLEAILLVGLTYINNLILSFMINAGTFEAKLGEAMGSQAAILKSQLVNTAPSVFALAGIERIFALTIQIALSLLVLYAVKKRNLGYLLLAILIHTLVNFPAVYLLEKGINLWYVELVLGGFAIIALVCIIKFRDKMGNGIGALGKF